MSVSGQYYLKAQCEACGEHWGIYAPTRMEAKAMAREEGWMFTPKSLKAFCPVHAEERRKTRDRP